MKLQTFAVTDTGRARRGNEDSFLIAPDLGLVAVADGMGGYQRGDVASELACSVLREALAGGRDLLARFQADPTQARRDEVLDLVEDAVQQACRQIHDASLALAGEGGRMGTTLDAVLVVGSTAFLVHVGDGRIYLQRGGELHPLTEDHTLVQQQLREGLIDQEQARRARKKNVITRALGVFSSVLVDSLVFEVDPRDAFLICSDGLHRYVGRRELGYVMQEGQPEEGLRRLVAMANERGGRDNITVVYGGFLHQQELEPDARTQERMEVLRRVDLFQFCTYRQLLAFTQACQDLSAPAGTVLFEDGQPGTSAYVVVSGSVAIEKGDTRLALLEPGHYFGELSFLDHPVRSATARVLQDGRFLVIDKDHFLRLVKQDGDLGTRMLWQMLRKVAGHLRSTNERLVAETVSVTDLLVED